jgi:exonuclease VII small subunit
MPDPTATFAATLHELAAIRTDLEVGRVGVDDLSAVLHRADRLVAQGRALLRRGTDAVEDLETRLRPGEAPE